MGDSVRPGKEEAEECMVEFLGGSREELDTSVPIGALPSAKVFADLARDPLGDAHHPTWTRRSGAAVSAPGSPGSSWARTSPGPPLSGTPRVSALSRLAGTNVGHGIIHQTFLSASLALSPARPARRSEARARMTSCHHWIHWTPAAHHTTGAHHSAWTHHTAWTHHATRPHHAGLTS